MYRQVDEARRAFFFSPGGEGGIGDSLISLAGDSLLILGLLMNSTVCKPSREACSELDLTKLSQIRKELDSNAQVLS